MILAVSFVFLSGCQAQADEVSDRMEEVGFITKQPQPAKTLEMNKTAPAENPINTLSVNKGNKPETLSIPAIGIEAEVLPLGTEKDGRMAVPKTPDEVSWFEPGYLPGENGRAVIAGHVDAVGDPAIFWDLADLKACDEIMVAGGEKELKFKVYAMESVELDLADIEDIFGCRSTPELVLITCSGEFDFERGTRRERQKRTLLNRMHFLHFFFLPSLTRKSFDMLNLNEKRGRRKRNGNRN
ncbi:Sortase family protein [Planococcus massiliensis]|uniref:Sortase family protein n=1 Tax=Planococcus massiliensis TaxID=1499687 RepID=A0A098EN82_9BACL|nr:class F sortase [Planococcus massiliensis]CEG23749.1 Sortase family protein [Planococcus massiliensis]